MLAAEFCAAHKSWWCTEQTGLHLVAYIFGSPRLLRQCELSVQLKHSMLGCTCVCSPSAFLTEGANCLPMCPDSVSITRRRGDRFAVDSPGYSALMKSEVQDSTRTTPPPSSESGLDVCCNRAVGMNRWLLPPCIRSDAKGFARLISMRPSTCRSGKPQCDGG